MRKTNRILALLLAVAMLASLLMTGCGRAPARDEEPKRPAATESVVEEKKPAKPGKEMSKTELATYCETRVVKVNVAGDGFSGHGTGFFIDDDGTLITNYHVIEGADEISIQFDNGASYSVSRIVDFSPYHDIAVLKADVSDTDYFVLSDEGGVKGENIYVSGYPKDASVSMFDEGTINSPSEVKGMMDCYTISATINSGNSGGPLFNSKGEVLGINTMTRNDAQNMNYSVNITTFDELALDKNYSISRYREWYNKEIGRSYYELDGSSFYSTYVHTYTTVTGVECLRSMNSNKDYKMGYSIAYIQYAYEYDIENYDKYVDYLYSLGFEYEEAARDRGVDVTRYRNAWYGYYIDLQIDTVDNILYVYCPTY